MWWIRGGRGWRIDVETLVAAPPELVFAILDDPARARDLDPRIVGVEVLGPGRQRVHMRVARRDVVMEAVDAAREPPTLLAWDVVDVRVGGKPRDAGTQRGTFTLERVEGGTRVRLTIRGRPGGATSRWAIGTRHGIEARAMRKLLRRLRDYASA